MKASEAREVADRVIEVKNLQANKERDLAIEEAKRDAPRIVNKLFTRIEKSAKRGYYHIVWENFHKNRALPSEVIRLLHEAGYKTERTVTGGHGLSFGDAVSISWGD